MSSPTAPAPPSAARGSPSSAATPASRRAAARLGEIYHAAPDADFRGFVDDMQRLRQPAERMTVAVNMSDSALRLSGAINRASRAGRPDMERAQSRSHATGFCRRPRPTISTAPGAPREHSRPVEPFAHVLVRGSLGEQRRADHAPLSPAPEERGLEEGRYLLRRALLDLHARLSRTAVGGDRTGSCRTRRCSNRCGERGPTRHDVQICREPCLGMPTAGGLFAGPGSMRATERR